MVLIIKNHPYRQLDGLIDFHVLARPLQALYSEKGRKEKGSEFALRCLVLQFLEDLSDREMTRYLQENTAAKWFCNMGLETLASHHSYFGEFRSRLGTKGLMDLFNVIRKPLKSQGLIREVFTFIDASQLISQLDVWDDRDKAIKAKMDTFDNQNAAKIASDKPARFGYKGKNKHWFGYKEHASVDRQSGLINKIAATPANITDAQAAKHVCPDQGAVCADKAYCIKPATTAIKAKGCHDATLKRNNMKSKDHDKDAFHSRMRMPYERVFSQRNKRTRYQGTAKAQFQVGIRAITFNLKRLLKLGVIHLPLQVT
ncbi:MAG: transposase [Ostreibacterium sp.]